MSDPVWTRCETYLANLQHGIVLTVSAPCAPSTKELMTVASESILTSHEALSALLSELHDLSPLLPKSSHKMEER